MERQGRLGGVEDEQLAPAQPQQRHLGITCAAWFCDMFLVLEPRLLSVHERRAPDLVRDGQLGEIRDVSGPFHDAEEQPGSQFADVVDAHGVVRAALLAVLVSITAAWIRLRSQQLGDELRHRLASAADAIVVVVELAAQATGAAYGRDGRTEAGLRWDASALNCCSLVGGQGGVWRMRRKSGQHQGRDRR